MGKGQKMQRQFVNITGIAGKTTDNHSQLAKSCNINSIQSLLLTRSEIASILNMSEGNAIKILAKHGVQPIDLGRGRGNGLRWHTSAVIEVADILHTKAQAKFNPKRKKFSPYSVKGKSAKELLAEFNRGNTPNAEVCNGN